MDSLNDVASVTSKDALAAFVRKLRDELEHDPTKFENSTLESYLEALSAWIDDMGGYYLARGEQIPLQPTWKTIAEMLLAATMYE